MISISPISSDLLFLLELLKEGCRIHIRIALGTHTLDHRAVVDLYGFRLDISHHDSCSIQNYRTLHINIAFDSAGNYRAGGSDITDHHGTLSDLHAAQTVHLTGDLRALGINLSRLGITLNCTRDIQLTKNVKVTVYSTDQLHGTL